jgi:hypothetical protein
VALITDFWPQGPHDHVVQFYGHDDELAAGVAPYLAEGIHAGGVAIAIATEPHRRVFAARLAEAGIDPASGRARPGRTGPALVMLDAGEAAGALLVDGRIDPHRFDTLIGDLVRGAAAGGRLVRAYGEIVAVLWAEGHVRAALELEELWNGLRREVEFSLYCAYPRAWMEAEAQGCADPFDEVCRLHSAVVDHPGPSLAVHELGLEVEATFQWSGRSPAQARRFVVDTLIAWRCSGLANAAALIATELATNAVLHARTDFSVAVSSTAEGTIRIAVRDASPLRPRRRLAGPLDTSGRGLALVDALAAGWGADPFPGGKEVWAVLGPTHSPADATPR